MSPHSHNYSLVTLNEHLFAAGFAGTRSSLLVRKSPSGHEIKVVVATPSNFPEGKAIKFAKKATKHIRVSRGWSAVSASVQPLGIRELPPLGTPQQTEGNLTAWIVE
jgi:hypothetical protein